MLKKGDLSITVIIVAALALVVFVVLAAMFTGKTKDFSKGLQSCVGKQGKCGATCDNGAIIENTDCASKNSNEPICCIKIT